MDFRAAGFFETDFFAAVFFATAFFATAFVMLRALVDGFFATAFVMLRALVDGFFATFFFCGAARFVVVLAALPAVFFRRVDNDRALETAFLDFAFVGFGVALCFAIFFSSVRLRSRVVRPKMVGKYRLPPSNFKDLSPGSDRFGRLDQ